MSYLQALEILADHPHVWRYRQLCEDPNPVKAQEWRTHMVRKATLPAELPAEAAADPGETPPTPCCGGVPPGIYD